MRLESIQTTDRGEAAFDNISHGVAVAIFIAGSAYLFGRENASELEETFGGVTETGRHTSARAHQAGEVGDVDLRAWNVDG